MYVCTYTYSVGAPADGEGGGRNVVRQSALELVELPARDGREIYVGRLYYSISYHIILCYVI